MTRRGYELGVELGRVWDAGKNLLPQAADDIRTAWVNTPGTASNLTSRSSGIGNDPGGKLDEMLRLMNKALLDTEDALRDVGQALVWTADDYQFSDTEAEKTFQDQKKKLEG